MTLISLLQTTQCLNSFLVLIVALVDFIDGNYTLCAFLASHFRDIILT